MRARLLLLAAALAAFGGSLFAGFHVDDYAIFSGTAWRPLGWPHPVTHLIDWVNVQVAGQEAVGYHAVNLMLHLAAVMLAYECWRRLLPAGAALVAAGIFAVHPLQAEAVDSVAARGAMVVAALGFAALWTWIAGSSSAGVPSQQAEACATSAARKLRPRNGLMLALTGRRFVAAAIALAAVAEAAARPAGYAYALVAVRFLRLFAVPWGFTVSPDVHEPLWLAVAAAIGVAGVAVWRWRKLSVRSEVSWVLAGLVLLIPSFSANPAADPRAYLPVFAFAAAAGLLVARVPGRALGIGAVAILAAVSVSRTYVWMSDERLWREAVRRAPDLVEPKIELAKSLRAADALELLNRARQQAPYNPEVPAEIGKVLLDEQQYDGAVEELSRAVALDPRNALAFNNRGVALAALGQPVAAAADFQRALTLDPKLAEARENLKRLGVK